MLEFQCLGFGLVFNRETIQRIINYVCFAHNNFASVQGSGKSPRELVVGKPTSNHSFAVFGSKVLAELPQSVLDRNPTLSRFVSAAYLHPEFASMGCWVISRVRIGQEMVRRVFVAKSIKLSLPITIQNDYGLFVPLVDERSGKPEQPDVNMPNQPATILDEPQQSGPPLKWVEDHGITLGCPACRHIEIYGTRANKNHSRSCIERYSSWFQSRLVEQPSERPQEEMKEEVKQESPEGPRVMPRDTPSGVAVPPTPDLDLEPDSLDPSNDQVLDEPSFENMETEIDPEYAKVGLDEFAQSDDKSPVTPRSSGVKRGPDTTLSQLETDLDKEINAESRKRPTLMSAIGAIGNDMEFASEISCLDIFALAFAATAETCVIIPFGNRQIKVWQPASSVDDSTLKELNGKATLQGMIKELGNLSDMKCGDLYTATEFNESALKNSC